LLTKSPRFWEFCQQISGTLFRRSLLNGKNTRCGFYTKMLRLPRHFLLGDGRWAVGDANESHSAYMAKNRLFANVTNLSHAIAYVQVLFSVFEPE
jgi:hypothetical protein